MKQLNNYIINRIKDVKLPSNITREQSQGLKSLLDQRDTKHISVSDKGGEFVVVEKGLHRDVTTDHITTAGVYRYVAPTRMYAGREQPIAKPTDTTFNRQLKAKRLLLETNANKLWSQICDNHKFDNRVRSLLQSHNTSLPTMYVLIKTHKFDVNHITSPADVSSMVKVRPIVSCSGSPTEKLAWLCTTILSPLLDHVPCHLQNIHKHLELLSTLSSEQLKGRQFCSGDVSALYTNIDIRGCIESVIEMAAEHVGSLDLLGLTLVEVHQILELVLGSSYFTFDNKLYLQLVGLFMGCKPSPIGAVVRMYIFAKRSIYIDPYYLSSPAKLLYSIYIDDGATVASSRDEAVDMFDRIAAADPDKRIKWEVDFPTTQDTFTPFLGTQIMIDQDGDVHYKYYRKEQKKQISLHFKSHHPLKTKVEVAKNMYKTADISSSSLEYREESYGVVDYLLRCNGYANPRELITARIPSVSTRLKDPEAKMIYMKLPYLSEDISRDILRFIKSKELPITVIFLPGRRLRDLLCSSRPYDGRKCTITNCMICTKLTGNKDCSVLNPVYQIICNHCKEMYIGESSRTAHERLGEHLRYASNPTAESYKEEALAVHYRACHPGLLPDLEFTILRTENKTVLRKIYEALLIYSLKPSINDKEECKLLERFLIKGQYTSTD